MLKNKITKYLIKVNKLDNQKFKFNLKLNN